jgi:hypothetical protein
MRISPGLFAFAVTVIAATSAAAATVTTEQGEVLVNRGTGFKPATQPMEVSSGDQVMVKPKGRGHVVFPDGCTVKVAPGAVFTVGDKSPCERRGSHIETASSTPSAANAADESYVIPSLLAAGVPIAIIQLRDNLRSASP